MNTQSEDQNERQQKRHKEFAALTPTVGKVPTAREAEELLRLEPELAGEKDDKQSATL
jgi:hypothetical protein